MIERILVGVDGSDDSRRALDFAARLAQRLDAEILAVHALGLLDRLHPGDELVSSSAHREEITKTFRTEWCVPLDAHRIPGRRIVEDGPPAMALLRLAAAEAVDMIIVGSRGVGGFPELLLGSTSMQLVQHATVPVTVIPGANRPDLTPGS